MRLLYTAIRRNRGSSLRQRCGHGSLCLPAPCGHVVDRSWQAFVFGFPACLAQNSRSMRRRRKRTTTKVCLNREAEFVRCARLAGDGGSDYDDSILAIAHIEPALIYNSLDLLDDAQTSQYRFWRRFAGAPMDGAIYFFNITQVFASKSYQPKQTFSRSRVKSFFTTLEEGEPERLLATLRHNGHVPHWVDVAEAPVVMLRLPTPFARLVSSGRWTSVGVCVCVCEFQAYHNMSSGGSAGTSVGIRHWFSCAAPSLCHASPPSTGKGPSSPACTIQRTCSCWRICCVRQVVRFSAMARA